ncbi:hypothetical protein [Bradyrhizobium sp. WSM1417]|uniref:hypothetical protein n=1 Tax=Bradyrhizobium sp. WSM1417 TaxID=754500 RepID=UPI0012EC4281|nr:hypothetical protein [Bradyrhizobium sp. WSM1417]
MNVPFHDSQVHGIGRIELVLFAASDQLDDEPPYFLEEIPALRLVRGYLRVIVMKAPPV